MRKQYFIGGNYAGIELPRRPGQTRPPLHILRMDGAPTREDDSSRFLSPDDFDEVSPEVFDNTTLNLRFEDGAWQQ